MRKWGKYGIIIANIRSGKEIKFHETCNFGAFLEDMRGERMSVMKKCMYYPLWRADELELKLAEMEQGGWRLLKIRPFYRFEFKQSQPRDTEYVILYEMTRDRSAGMYRFEQELLSVHNADCIPNKHGGYDIYRICGQNRDFCDLKEYRMGYFKHVLLQYMLIALMFLLTGIGLLAAWIFQGGHPAILWFSMVYFALTLAVFMYRLYGYRKQCARCKKYHRDEDRIGVTK